MSPGTFRSPSRQKFSMCVPPSPSMSKQLRDTKWRSRSTCWNGHSSPPEQRRTTPPSSLCTLVLSEQGQCVGNWNLRVSFGRSSGT